MVKPQSKQSRYEGGRRPWNVGTTPRQPPQETERQRRERELCLNCPERRCPSLVCPLAKQPKEEPKRRRGPKVPENFLYYGRVETVQQLSQRYQVGKHTVTRWRKETGLAREKGKRT